MGFFARFSFFLILSKGEDDRHYDKRQYKGHDNANGCVDPHLPDRLDNSAKERGKTGSRGQAGKEAWNSNKGESLYNRFFAIKAMIHPVPSLCDNVH